MRRMNILIAAFMLLAALTACSAGSQDQTAQSTTPSTDTSTRETVTQPETTAPETVFEEIILVENEDIIFKITGVENDPIWGYTLTAYLENNTAMELMFTLDNVSVNGFMCDPFWASTVDSSKKANEKISFSNSDFESNGIESVSEITFTLRVYDSNDWTAEDIFCDTFTVKP